MVGASAKSIRDGLIKALSDLTNLQQSGELLRAIVREEFLWRLQAKRYYLHYQQLLKENK